VPPIGPLPSPHLEPEQVDERGCTVSQPSARQVLPAAAAVQAEWVAEPLAGAAPSRAVPAPFKPSTSPPSHRPAPT
jgi:hypothetical protein